MALLCALLVGVLLGKEKKKNLNYSKRNVIFFLL